MEFLLREREWKERGGGSKDGVHRRRKVLASRVFTNFCRQNQREMKEYSLVIDNAVSLDTKSFESTKE